MLDLLRPIYEKTARVRPLRPRRAGVHLEVADKALALKQAA